MSKVSKVKEIHENNAGKCLIGKVLWFSERDGNGIIVEEESGNEVYFDKSVLIDQKIRAGERVKFYYNEKITDCLCAKGVKEI